jgi:raffinose/stachyose/melibiose transport system substrate-binding protein
MSALALSGCAPTTGGGGNGDGDVTLSVWSWRTEDAAGFETIFDVYEESHPGVTVEFKPFKNTEYNTILATGLAGSDGPDVAMLHAGVGGLAPLVAADRLLPLDPAVVTSLKDFDPAVLASGGQVPDDDNIYGLPIALQTLQMFYNKQIFADNGIDVPATYDEFIEANETLLAAGITPMSTTGKDNWMLGLALGVVAGGYWAAGPYFDGLADGSATLADGPFAESVQTMSDVTPFFPANFTGVNYTESQILFTSGLAAMYPGGSFELGFFQSTAPDLDLGVFSVPAPDGAEGGAVVPSWVDADFGVSKASPNQDAALELVNWMGTAEFAQLYVDELKQISPVKGVEPSDPVLKEIIAAYQASPGSYIPVGLFAGGDPDTSVTLATSLQNMFAGTGDPTSVAQDYADAVAKAFPDGR